VSVIQNSPATGKAAAPTEHPADRHPYGVAIDDLVALSLAAQTAPMRCYVGKVVYLGKDGVRIRLMDRSTGCSCSFDVFVPWRNVESALVATTDHDTSDFGDEAEHWQMRMNNLDEIRLTYR
jgi:hypothetical protein